MKRNIFSGGCLAIISMLFILCSCDNAVKKLIRNGEREKIVNELLLLKNELPMKVDNTEVEMTDVSVDGDTLVFECSVPNEYWEMIQPTIDKANTDRNVARLVESLKDGYADKLIAGGLGFKYVYRNNNSGKYLFSICASPERLKDLKDRLDRGALKPYSTLELTQMEIEKMKLPSKIEDGVWLTDAYIKGNSLFYDIKVEAKIDPANLSSADVADMRQSIIESLKEEKMLKLYKKNIVKEGIHFVYVYNDSRGIEFARIDIGPEIFMYE